MFIIRKTVVRVLCKARSLFRPAVLNLQISGEEFVHFILCVIQYDTRGDFFKFLIDDICYYYVTLTLITIKSN